MQLHLIKSLNPEYRICIEYEFISFVTIEIFYQIIIILLPPMPARFFVRDIEISESFKNFGIENFGKNKYRAIEYIN